MKTKNLSNSRQLAVFLSIALLGSVSFASEPERVLFGSDLTPVNRLLAEGWTVRHQSLAASSKGTGYGFSSETFYLITLTPPPPERIAENEAKLKAELERKRAEFLAKKNQAVEAK